MELPTDRIRIEDAIPYREDDAIQMLLEDVQYLREAGITMQSLLLEQGDCLKGVAQNTGNVAMNIGNARLELKQASHYKSTGNVIQSSTVGSLVGGVGGLAAGGLIGAGVGVAAGGVVTAAISGALNSLADRSINKDDTPSQPRLEPRARNQNRIQSSPKCVRETVQRVEDERVKVDRGSEKFHEVQRALVDTIGISEENAKILLEQDAWVDLSDEDLYQVQEELKKSEKLLRRMNMSTLRFLFSLLFERRSKSKRRHSSHVEKIREQEKAVRKQQGELDYSKWSNTRNYFTVRESSSIFQLVKPTFSARFEVHAVNPIDKRKRICLTSLRNQTNSSEEFSRIVQSFSVLEGRSDQEQYELLLSFDRNSFLQSKGMERPSKTSTQNVYTSQSISPEFNSPILNPVLSEEDVRLNSLLDLLHVLKAIEQRNGDVLEIQNKKLDTKSTVVDESRTKLEKVSKKTKSTR